LSLRDEARNVAHRNGPVIDYGQHGDENVCCLMNKGPGMERWYHTDSCDAQTATAVAAFEFILHGALRFCDGNGFVYDYDIKRLLDELKAPK
jgi:hypothetical protein